MKAIGCATIAGVVIWAVLLGTLIARDEGGWSNPDSISAITWMLPLPFIPLIFFLRRFPPLAEVEPEMDAPSRFHAFLAYGTLASAGILLTIGIPVLTLAGFALDWERVLEMLAMISLMFFVGLVPVFTWRLHWYGDQRNNSEGCSQQRHPED